jgi:hypothetical protein
MNPGLSLKPVIATPGNAPGLRAFGNEVMVHLGGGQTGGKFTMFTDITPPGGGPPPHYLTHEDEWFWFFRVAAMVQGLVSKVNPL